MNRVLVLAFAGSIGLCGQQSIASQIVERSCAAMNQDWKAIPGYSYLSREVESKHGRPKTVKAYRVFMIEGSTYNELVAVNDQALAPRLQTREQAKMAAEIRRRRHESRADHDRRVAKYLKERHQDHELMQQMTKAFSFTLRGEEVLNGHKVWRLKAAPNPAYVPSSTETKVLLGMQGQLWVEQEHYHWVKVEAEVMKPVSLFGFVAKVQPGTRFMLEQAPVAPGVWLPKHFTTDVNASALGFIDESSTDDETYRDYRPMSEVARLLSDAH